MVKVSVIIPTLNRKRLLADCLHSLMKQTYRDFEVVVVDSGCTDETEELVMRFPVRWVTQKGRQIERASAAASENRGMVVAHGDVLAFMDDDEIAAEDWLERIVECYERIRADGVGGRILEIQKPLITPRLHFRLMKKAFSIIAENKLTMIGLMLRSGEPTGNFDMNAATYLDVHHLPGGNMSFRRQVFHAVGLFDESYAHTSFRYETDFCLRARAMGFRLIYNPNAVVHHQGSIHTSRPLGTRLGATLFYNTINDITFVLKRRHQIERFSWFRLILRQTLLVINYIRFTVRRKNLAYLSGPLGILFALRNWIQNNDDVRLGRLPGSETIAYPEQVDLKSKEK